ncbi:sporulation integral membrane protein YtvI [Mesobacillus harenae]|uniref:sporulation integral membrane protein YtvI n=1 Tax=Mesobacillus harenae TaxID=2213203 RepID=UPI0015811531|nr:sporulation integral membrane protein YtvI [Mesobacillus harenae]
MFGFFTKRLILTTLGIIVAALVLYIILPVSVPLIAAIITALLLDPLVKLIQARAKIARRVSVLIVFILFLLFVGLSGYFIITKVVTEAINIVENAPTYINEITKEWENVEERFVEAAKDLPEDLVHEISGQVEEFLNNSKNDLIAYINIDNVKALLTNIPNYLVSFLVYIIALFLFLLELPRLRIGMYKHLTEKTADKVKFMTSRLSYVVLGFMKAQFLVSLIIFAVSLIGLWFIVPEIALVMSLIIWIIDFIPIIGSIVILGPWALFHLITGDVVLATKLGILAAILLIIRRTVEPKMMGSHIGLSPLATLIAMYLGLKLLGILGFIVGPLVLIAFNSAKEAGLIKMNFKI